MVVVATGAALAAQHVRADMFAAAGGLPLSATVGVTALGRPVEIKVMARIC